MVKSIVTVNGIGCSTVEEVHTAHSLPQSVIDRMPECWKYGETLVTFDKPIKMFVVQRYIPIGKHVVYISYSLSLEFLEECTFDLNSYFQRLETRRVDSLLEKQSARLSKERGLV